MRHFIKLGFKAVSLRTWLKHQSRRPWSIWVLRACIAGYMWLLYASCRKTFDIHPEAGVGMVADWAQREFYVFNHLEYDRETLKTEYERDLAKGAGIHMPLNYFPDDNPKHSPPNMWRAFAAVVFQNWLNFVYQGTPYDLNTLNEAVHETFHKTGV